jgi:1-acyl-sn-glycerol-3-phosphate acyltransferase
MDQAWTLPRAYAFWRGVVRLWFSLSFRKIRLLGGKRLAAWGPTILAISHPASFLDALILLAALDREVHCLIDREFIRGPLRGLLARAFGMIAYESGGKDWRPALEACGAVLKKGKAVLVFADRASGKPAGEGELAETAASVALGAEDGGTGQPVPELLPVHIFLPIEQSQSRELLIYIDFPVLLERDGHRAGGDLHQQVRALAGRLESQYRENAFRLPSLDLEAFLADLEEVLRAELEDDWASRPNWKQKAEGFRISGFVLEWAEQLNYLNPGRLVALRDSLDALAEARRHCALRKLKVGAASAWLDSPVRRIAVWVESTAGLPAAIYGLINHLPALLILYVTGLLKKKTPDRKADWLIRALVVIGCYAGQLFIVAHYGGRAAAGYYAPTLPLSALYLWRYIWLLRHRSGLAFEALALSGQASKLRRMRKGLIRELNETLSAYAGTHLGGASPHDAG